MKGHLRPGGQSKGTLLEETGQCLGTRAGEQCLTTDVLQPMGRQYSTNSGLGAGEMLLRRRGTSNPKGRHVRGHKGHLISTRCVVKGVMCIWGRGPMGLGPCPVSTYQERCLGCGHLCLFGLDPTQLGPKGAHRAFQTQVLPQ